MKKTVLVIDDEAHVRMLYAEELRSRGYDSVTADGSEDVLALVARNSPGWLVQR